MDYKKKYEEALERAKKWYNEEEPDSYTCIVESIFPELQKDENEEPQENKEERIRKALISILKSDFEKDTTIFDISVGEIIAWLEKQGQSKKTSIWKHWRDGIAGGNGNGIPVFLIKNGSTYSLSSCLGFECDYIELSELDNLMLEQQGGQKELSQSKEINKGWSKEDERLCQCLIRDQEKALDEVRNDKYGHSEIISDLKEMYRERIDWLESLKQRISYDKVQD